MTAPNRNTLWGELIMAELAAAGIDTVCAAPGSRSTPLTAAAYDHPELTVQSHLDERSMAYFALGRARRSGMPTPIISTSGTAAANFHPAVIEAAHGRVPMLVLTADRPPELQESGANQTIDQHDLYGDAPLEHMTLPEPAPEPRTLRALRTQVARAFRTATGTPAGPVHLNIPFRKPLEPIAVPDDVPDDLGPRPVTDRTDAFVETTEATPTPTDIQSLVETLNNARRPLIVAGPADPPPTQQSGVITLARATGAPVLADPLSGARFHPAVADEEVLICGGFDAYLGQRAVDAWPAPDVVVRTGASPTSKALRKYLAAVDCRQFLIDPAGEWREAEFTATDLLVGAPTPTLTAVADQVPDGTTPAADWQDRFARAERQHWELLADAPPALEGQVLFQLAGLVPDPTTMMVSNSMPVRDLDRFGRPRAATITTIANRGASGIDGITSTALGSADVTSDPLVLVTGDLAYYHDMNGLLAISRQHVDATIVIINNDGGGIFHKLPIESFDPPFTEGFKTPHGLDFAPTGELYDLTFQRVQTLDRLADVATASIGSPGTTVIEIPFDAETSHRHREELAMTLQETLFGDR